jgi:predicted dehydrogenase
MGQCAHLQNYVTLPECEVVAIAELREDLARTVAARYGVPRVYHDHAEMLAQETLDGVVAAQPYNRHGQIVPELIGAGVPVFTEKPLARSVQVGQRIVEAVRKEGGRYWLGYHKRSDPATLHAKEQIDQFKASGEIGALRYVRILMPAGDWIAQGSTHLIQTNARTPSLATDPLPSDMNKEMGREYDSFVNYYIHQVNLMRYLLGEDYVVAYADPSGVLLAVQSESGVAGTIEMSPYRTTIDWQEEALVAFEQGYVKLELPAPLACNRPGQVTVFRDPGKGAMPETTMPQLPWIHAMRQQASFFLRALQGEQTPLCEAQEALRDLEIAREYVRMRHA